MSYSFWYSVAWPSTYQIIMALKTKNGLLIKSNTQHSNQVVIYHIGKAPFKNTYLQNNYKQEVEICDSVELLK